MRYIQRADAENAAGREKLGLPDMKKSGAAAGDSNNFIVSGAARFVNRVSHKNMILVTDDSIDKSHLRLLGEVQEDDAQLRLPVVRRGRYGGGPSRYEAMDGTAVHAACMEEFLLETVGVEALAARAGYEHRREVEMDAERGEGL